MTAMTDIRLPQSATPDVLAQALTGLLVVDAGAAFDGESQVSPAEQLAGEVGIQGPCFRRCLARRLQRGGGSVAAQETAGLRSAAPPSFQLNSTCTYSIETSLASRREKNTVRSASRDCLRFPLLCPAAPLQDRPQNDSVQGRTGPARRARKSMAIQRGASRGRSAPGR